MIRIVLFFIGLLFLINTSYPIDVSQLNLNLISQSPDPVKAGSDLVIRVRVENLGPKEIKDLKIKVVDSYPFSLFPGENREEYIGTLFSTASGNSQVVKFKLKVADDIKDGTYPLKILTSSTNGRELENEIEFRDKVKFQC